MKNCSILIVLFAVGWTVVTSQYNSPKHSNAPYSHSNDKKTGTYPGSFPTGYQHNKQTQGRGYGPIPHGSGPYGGPYRGGYTGYGFPYYEKCYPVYSTYGKQENTVRYLATANEDILNQNTSNFISHKLPIHETECEKGPKQLLHTVYGEWHYPPVIKGNCDGLPGCKNPKCIPVKTIKKTVCVLVFRRYGYRWIRVGFRKITFKTDTSCKCRECHDIKSYKECVHTHPCPNKHNKLSYCYWKRVSHYSHHQPTPHVTTPTNKTTPHYQETRSIDEEESNEIDSDTDEYTHIDDTAARARRSSYEYQHNDRYDNHKDPYDPYKHTLRPVPAGKCSCCLPYVCKPPQQFDYDNCKCICPKKKCSPGHKFNPKTCKCECPQGTVLDKKRMKCIGICKKVSSKACEHVVCKDNPHFYCKLDKKYNCVCPDCNDVDYWQRGLCKKTKCIDQSYYKPQCVFDWRNGKCRCPECADQKNPRDCERTVCDVDPKKRHEPNYRGKECKWTWYPYPSCVCKPHGYYGNNNKNNDRKPPSRYTP